MDRKIFLQALYFISSGLLVILAGCNGKTPPPEAPVREVVKGVTLSEVNIAPVEDYYETSGTVRPKSEHVISSRIPGLVTSVKVTEGSRVSAGQLLLTIDDRDAIQRTSAAEMSVEAAMQNMKLAVATYNRYKKLHEGLAITTHELEQVETQKKNAESELERARAGLAELKVNQGFSIIRSPVTGIVTEKHVENGSTAMPGAPLLTVADTSGYRAEAYIDERLAAGIRTGTPVNVKIDSTGQDINASISEIIPVVDPASRTFIIKIDLKDTSLQSGMYAKIAIPRETRQLLLVPADAVVEKGQLAGVYTAGKDGVITYRLIKTGKTHGKQIEVLSGLSGGEKIITSGLQHASDGGVIVN